MNCGNCWEARVKGCLSFLFLLFFLCSRFFLSQELERMFLNSGRLVIRADSWWFCCSGSAWEQGLLQFLCGAMWLISLFKGKSSWHFEMYFKLIFSLWEYVNHTRRNMMIHCTFGSLVICCLIQQAAWKVPLQNGTSRKREMPSRRSKRFCGRSGGSKPTKQLLGM